MMFTVQVFANEAGHVLVSVYDSPNVGGTPVLRVEGPAFIGVQSLHEFLTDALISAPKGNPHFCKSGHVVMYGHCQAQRDNCVCGCPECSR